MNKSILLGRLTKTPEIKYSQANNIKVANFTLAVNRSYVKPGEERKADFINFVAYSKLADFVEKYLTTGLQICVSGRIQTRNYEDKNGQRRYVTEVIAEEICFADRVKNKVEQNEEPNSEEIMNKTFEEAFKEDNSTEDDFPF